MKTTTHIYKQTTLTHIAYDYTVPEVIRSQTFAVHNNKLNNFECNGNEFAKFCHLHLEIYKHQVTFNFNPKPVAPFY